MVTFVVRFYGRFLLARERRGGAHTGNATFIAPSLEFPPEIGQHRPVVSIQRGVVSGDPVRTTVPPTFRTIPGPDPLESEFLMWDLSGTSVSVPSSGGFRLTETDLLPDLDVLEAAMGRTSARLDRAHLTTGKRASATVAFQGGDAEARATVANSVQFIPEDEARNGLSKTRKVAGLSGTQIADWIEVSLSLPGVVDAYGVELGRLVLSLRGRQNGSIFIEGPDRTQISFSNLCSTCPRSARQFDLEFGQYYELLVDTFPDRLILGVSHLGDQDCNESAQMSYDM